jgi:hypothetical protein
MAEGVVEPVGKAVQTAPTVEKEDRRKGRRRSELAV